LDDNPSISGGGVNKFIIGFTPENLSRHWRGGISDHSWQYPNYTKERYAKEALDLIQSAVSNTITGYKNNLGQVIRYDTIKNNFVIGHPDIGIATMFKPVGGIEYYYEKAGDEAVED
jgi:pyocin large subunit-like protein